MIHPMSPSSMLEIAIGQLIKEDCELEMPIFLTRPDENQIYPCIRIEVLSTTELFPASGVFKSSANIILESKFDTSPDLHGSNAMQLLQTFYFNTPLEERLTAQIDDFTVYGVVPAGSTEMILPDYNIYQTTFTFEFNYMLRDNS